MVEAKRRRVIVAGSVNMDLVVRAPRHPRTGETVLGDDFRTFPGGKGANQAVAAARLGAASMLVAKLGVDTFGDILEEFLRSEDVDASHLERTPDHATGIGSIIVDARSENSIVVVPGANAALEPEEVRRVAVAAEDVLVSQLEISLTTVQAFFEHGKARGATTLLNPSPAQPCPAALLDLADILVLNEIEAAVLTGTASLDPADTPAVEAAARALRARQDQVVVVTLGERGAIALQEGVCHPIPARRVRAVDPTGAGDCFVGALAARLVAGAPILEALRYASVAASLCVQVMGAGPSFPDRAALESVL